MSEQILKIRIKHKYDTEANWTAHNPILLKGEIAYSSDKGNVYKIGDGTAKWTALTYNSIPWTSVSGRPGSLKNPYALTLQFNGTSQTAYDGGAARTYNITPSAIGAAPANHTHSYLPLTGGTLTGHVIFSQDHQLSWNRNTDYFKMGFKNTSDADSDSYGYIETGDNGDEYFRIQRKSGSTVSVIASFKSEGLRLSIGNFIGNMIGNASSSDKLKTARSINGTNFDGSGNITTAHWGTARNITIGKTTKSVNGNGNVAWSLADIGAAGAGADGIATKAAGDSAGQNINTTYIKALAVNGQTLTYTKGNGAASTLTTQDKYLYQSTTTETKYRGLLLGYNASTDIATLDNPVTQQAYVCEKIYAQPSTGSLFANKLSVTQNIHVGECTFAYDASTNCLNFVFS